MHLPRNMRRNTFRIILVVLLLVGALSVYKYVAKDHLERSTVHQNSQASNNQYPSDDESEENPDPHSAAAGQSPDTRTQSDNNRSTEQTIGTNLSPVEQQQDTGVSSQPEFSNTPRASQPTSLSQPMLGSAPSPNTTTAAAPNYMQVATESRPQSKTPRAARIFGEGRGNFTVDGAPSMSAITLFQDNNVDVDGGHLISVINPGNVLLFAPKSHFVALLNAYELKDGASNVSTSTGMTAVVPDCFTVSPVNADIRTYFEVNWWGVSAFVYARVQDVDIRYWITGAPRPGTLHPRPPDRQWVLKQGHVARILNARECKPLVDLWPQSGLPAGVNAALAAGAIAVPGTIAGELWGTGSQPNLSAESPDQ